MTAARYDLYVLTQKVSSFNHDTIADGMMHCQGALATCLDGTSSQQSFAQSATPTSHNTTPPQAHAAHFLYLRFRIIRIA